MGRGFFWTLSCWVFERTKSHREDDETSRLQDSHKTYPGLYYILAGALNIEKKVHCIQGVRSVLDME